MKWFLILTFTLVGLEAYADFTFLEKKSKVQFLAKGWPSLLKIKGEGQEVDGGLELDQTGSTYSGEVKLDLKGLKTGIKLRDRHLKENYLKVNEDGKQYAVLKVKKLKLPNNMKGKANFTAQLLLNKVERPVEVKAQFKPYKGAFKVKAQFEVKITDFKIEVPSYKGVTVAEKVEVTADLVASESKK